MVCKAGEVGKVGEVGDKEKLAKIWKIFGGLGFVLHPLIVRHTYGLLSSAIQESGAAAESTSPRQLH